MLIMCNDAAEEHYVGCGGVLYDPLGWRWTPDRTARTVFTNVV
jgi:hypothetical protein